MARLLIVDDDPLSREVLLLLATEAGYAVEAFDGGLELLEALAAGFPADGPGLAGVLADLQMPAPCGEVLAQLTRSAAPAGTPLVAMSATDPGAAGWRGYDAFVQKPFTMDELAGAFRAAGRQALRMSQEAAAEPALDEAIFASFAQSLPLAQLQQLYGLCLDDVERRVAGLRTALLTGDEAAFRGGAHALKGGCGMVGARHLAALAARCETGPLPAVDDTGALLQFQLATADLRRILEGQYTASMHGASAPPELPLAGT